LECARASQAFPERSGYLAQADGRKQFFKAASRRLQGFTSVFAKREEIGILAGLECIWMRGARLQLNENLSKVS
jgi:hypothetical protein